MFPSLADKLEILVHKKPDIHVIDELLKKCFLVEITVCYDLYLEYAYDAKVERYKSLVHCLTENGYDAEMLVLCVGSLDSVRNDAWKCLRKFSKDRICIKELLKWCPISSIIGSNYIWRHRVKKLLVSASPFIFLSFLMFNVKVFNLCLNLVWYNIVVKQTIYFLTYPALLYWQLHLHCYFLINLIQSNLLL